MATTPYTGYTSSDKPATVTTTPAPIIDATKVGTTAPITLPTPSPYDIGNYTSAINSTVGSIEAQTNAALAQQEAQQKLAQAQAGSNDIATLQSQLGGKAADTANLYQSSGVNTAYNQLQDLNAQAMGLKNEASAIPIANRLQAQTLGTAGTENQVQNVNYDQLQRNALKALSLGQQAAIAESNYNKAKNLADQQVEIKYGQMEADLKAKQTQLDALNKYQLTPAQEKAKSALERQYKLQDQELADKKAEAKAVNELIVEASQFAPKDILTKAQAIKDNGGSSTEVAMALGQYGKDFLKNQLLREQLKTEQAQRAKIYTDIAKTKAETGAITDPVTGAVSKPLTEGQGKDLSYAQRGDLANPQIERVGATIVKMNPISFASQMKLANNPATSGQVSAEIRQYAQAERALITAILRRDSGATIQPSEFADARKIYVPAPGDDAQTLAQKKLARDTVINSFKQNVPNYSSRVSTPESSYLDSVDSSLKTVEQKTTPVSLYTSRLLGLPGIKP